MAETHQEATAIYPTITPASANLALKNDKQDDTCPSPQANRCDSASPQCDRLIIAGESPSPGSASSSRSSPDLARMPIKKRYKNYEPTATTNDDGQADGIELASEYDKENDGVDWPIINSRGLLKKYRCKRCPYVAIIKRNFWNHSRGCIKPEKLLACPKCPFVTEHKHHYESHLLHHLKSKPYKCYKCDYSSVSKHMLDSHLKFHFKLRRYHCDECEFATKYFHQFKLHLKKHSHREGFLLSEDVVANSPDSVVICRDTNRVASKRRKPCTEKNEQPLRQLANLVGGFSGPTTSLELDDAQPTAVPLVVCGYDRNALAGSAIDCVNDQIVPEVSWQEQSQSDEQIAPVDYSQRTPLYQNDADFESPVDLSGGGPQVPLDLSKNEATTESHDWPSSVDFNGYGEGMSLEGDDVRQQIQYLRANLESMRWYALTLERTYYTGA